MTTFHLPDLGEGLAEAEIVRWHVQPGDRIGVDQPLVAVETAKAVVEIPSPYSGVVRRLHGAAGEVIATGAPLVEFELESPEETLPAAENHGRADSGTVVGSMPTSEDELVENVLVGGGIGRANGATRAVPAARALAKRTGVNLAALSGSGRAGLITVDDVLAAMPFDARKPESRLPPLPLDGRVAREEKLRGLRRAMAQSMTSARDNVMNCTLCDDADLHHWRDGEDITTRLLRAIAAAAKAEPTLNAWFDGDQRVLHVLERVDVGMAVDSAEGLLVPVIRDVGGRGVQELRGDVDRLKRAARARTVTPEELRDFTFMLSNFGVFAGRYGTAVVVPPAVAILGCGRLSRDVVATQDGLEAHRRLPLSLSFDHRCVTGGEAARFLKALLEDLERGS
jgi:2-oxoisovalerate dehydrogenase E2 component (dihydrolipoyl transacylase)